MTIERKDMLEYLNRECESDKRILEACQTAIESHLSDIKEARMRERMLTVIIEALTNEIAKWEADK